jgi:hypothetical protein
VSLVRWDETLAARSSIRVSFRTIKREVFLDTIIFVLIFFTLLAMRTRRRWLVLTLY